jgi:hypothetical protein
MYERNWIQRLLRQPPKPVELSTIEKMQQGLFRPVATNWPNIGQVVVIMRELSEAQIYAIGDITMIKTFWDKIASQREPSVEEMSAYAERHDSLLRISMANPTYDDLLNMCGTYMSHEKVATELAGIKAQWKELPHGPEKVKLKKVYDGLELACKFILPPVFTAPLVAWITGVSRSDIDAVTYELLIKSATLATLGGDNPSDHIGGNFERFPGDKLLKTDIDNRAWWYLQHKKEFDNRQM